MKKKYCTDWTVFFLLEKKENTHLFFDQNLGKYTTEGNGVYQGFFLVLIDLIIELLGLIIVWSSDRAEIQYQWFD